LLEGSTGTGKTVLVKAVSSILAGTNKRISGIPDAQPGDLVGSEMYLLDSTKHVVHGAAYQANILLADEVNRFSPKAQSAFLEMLAEQQVTIGDNTYKLKNPFICIATLNPSEQHKGTSKLSEALSDRFVYKVLMKPTTADEKVEVAKRTHHFNFDELKQVMTLDDVNEAREYFFDHVYVDDKIRYYCARILNAINNPAESGLFVAERKVLENIQIFKQHPAANDRVMIHLESGGMAHAMLNGRDYVVPFDIASVATRILRGRLLLNPAAIPSLLDVSPHLQTESHVIDDLIAKTLGNVKVHGD
jgi:MoxR-like ATPase